MSKRSKACSIPPAVKRAVWERDGHCSILSGKYVPIDCACCHFVSRARGGLGIEQNIVTLTADEHSEFDNGRTTKILRERIRAYLISKYPDWDEANLRYTKE